MVLCQLWNYLIIFLTKPTTAAQELVKTSELSLAFTFCKIIFNTKFDGKFDVENHSSMKNLFILNKNASFDLLKNETFTYDFVSYVENPLMCKSFDLSYYHKNSINVVREFQRKKYKKENRNLHLYIHQPGMFYIQEFGLKFPSEIFGLRLNDDSNDNAKLQILSYDISMDPHLACSTKNYHDCINKLIINTFNNSIGCTYPIQR
jgi:hypothetical protein